MFRFLVLGILLAILCSGLVDYLTNFEDNVCEMTYMYQMPQYLKIQLDKEVATRFPRYGLYFYGEGQYGEQARKSNFRMSGIPVLFIPGNAGSHKQVRSLGSVAKQKADDTKSKFHFNYFALDFDEEFSALYGQSLYDEAEFTHVCIKKILSLYKGAASVPKSVVLVGHSMGGMVARSLFTLPDFKKDLVSTIITQATPHQYPAANVDHVLATFYDDVNTFWREHENTTVSDVTVLSTGGGYRDIQVRSHLTSLQGIVRPDRSVSADTMSVPRAWVSTDHLCHVWCKQIVLATKRALFDMVDRSTKQIAVSPFYRHAVFMHHFYKHPSGKKFKGAYDKTLKLDKNIKWEVRKKLSWKLWTDSIPKERYSVTEMPELLVPAEYTEPEHGYVAISNIENDKWLGICSLREKSTPGKPKNSPFKKKDDQPKECTQVENYAPHASQLPPLYSEKKVVHIDPNIVKDNTHIVAILPKTRKKVEIYSELYKLSERHIDYNVTGLLDFLKAFPRSIMDLDIVINKTTRGAVFYNISVLGLDIPLQAYTATLTTLNCAEAPPRTSSGAVMKLHTPWAQQPTYQFIGSGKNGSLSLKLMTARPSNVINTAQLHLYLLPTCTYRLTVSIAWSQLVGQFVRFYGPCLMGFLVIQVFMVLSYQLKSLDEQGVALDFQTSHAKWAQPWRVVPLALLIRFMLYFPETDNMAEKLGVPRDDRYVLESRGEWYAALPIMLYLSAYSIMGIQAAIVHGILATLGRVLGGITHRLSDSSVIKWCQYGLYTVATLLAVFVCGSLGIYIIFAVTFLKTISLYDRARRQSASDLHHWSAYYIHVSLLLLLFLAFILNVPSLLAWMKNIEYSVQLAVDPSQTVGVIVGVTAIILSLIQFPRYTGEIYGIGAALVYMLCVTMVMFTLLSIYRVTTYIYAALIIVTTAAILSYLLERSPPKPTPTKDKTE